MGNIGHKLRIVLFHKAHKGRAAGGEQEALLGKLLRLVLGHHIGAEGSLYHVVEAKLAQARDHLAELGIGKLAGDGGRHHGIDLTAEDQALFQHIHHLDDLADVGDGAEGTGIDARAAGDALLIVDICGLVLFGGHRDGLDLAGVLARTGMMDDGRVGADLRAHAALNALVLVDVGHVVVVKVDRAAAADVLAAVHQAALAHARNLIAGGGTFVTGDIEHADHVFAHSAHGLLDALNQNGPLFVHAAAHGGLGAGHDLFGQVQHVDGQGVAPGGGCHLPQNVVFEELYLGIKFAGLLRIHCDYLQLFLNGSLCSDADGQKTASRPEDPRSRRARDCAR